MKTKIFFLEENKLKSKKENYSRQTLKPIKNEETKKN